MATGAAKRKITRRKKEELTPSQPQEQNLHQLPVVNPIEIPLELIDEDPHQPRTVFNQELLEELASTIRVRGVKNPISVHINQDDPKRYVINDGARRYRASLMAGKKSIPAFVDPDFSKIDQIIVNAHHENFTPREWTVLIDQEEKKGKKRVQIAAELGKSSAFITYYMTLLELPDILADVFNSGRCDDVTAINHLYKIWKHHPEDVEFWIEDPTTEITRITIAKLRAFLDSRGQSDQINKSSGAAQARKTRHPDPTKIQRPIVEIEFGGRIARLILNRRPSQVGRAWFQFQDGSEMEEDLDKVQLVALREE